MCDHSAIHLQKIFFLRSIAAPAVQAHLEVIIMLIPHIVTDVKIYTLGGISHSDNRLSCSQGKAYFGIEGSFCLLSSSTMPQNHHSQEIQ